MKDDLSEIYEAEQKLEKNGRENRETLSPKETFHVIKGSLMAGLAAGLVFLAAFFLFILFCVKIWF